MVVFPELEGATIKHELWGICGWSIHGPVGLPTHGKARMHTSLLELEAIKPLNTLFNNTRISYTLNVYRSPAAVNALNFLTRLKFTGVVVVVPNGSIVTLRGCGCATAFFTTSLFGVLTRPIPNA